MWIVVFCKTLLMVSFIIRTKRLTWVAEHRTAATSITDSKVAHRRALAARTQSGPVWRHSAARSAVPCLNGLMVLFWVFPALTDCVLSLCCVTRTAEAKDRAVHSASLPPSFTSANADSDWMDVIHGLVTNLDTGLEKSPLVTVI